MRIEDRLTEGELALFLRCTRRHERHMEMYEREKKMSDKQMAAAKKRVEVWRHNSFLGHVAMARSNMRGISQSSTATVAAKSKAVKISILLEELIPLLKERAE